MLEAGAWNLSWEGRYVKAAETEWWGQCGGVPELEVPKSLRSGGVTSDCAGGPQMWGLSQGHDSGVCSPGDDPQLRATGF